MARTKQTARKLPAATHTFAQAPVTPYEVAPQLDRQTSAYASITSQDVNSSYAVPLAGTSASVYDTLADSSVASTGYDAPELSPVAGSNGPATSLQDEPVANPTSNTKEKFFDWNALFQQVRCSSEVDLWACLRLSSACMRFA